MPDHPRPPDRAAALLDRIADGSALVGIVGLGYVGLPLALAAARAGLPVLGFDVDAARVAQFNAGTSFISHIPTEALHAAARAGRFEATADLARLDEPDAILICVPTPLTRQREPDMTYIERTARAIAPRLRPGQVVVLESTTWPGTTDEVMRPILEAGGLRSGIDFFLAYSPEREDPGNGAFETATIPKVVGGDGADALKIAEALYGRLVVRTVPVSSARTAEAVKLTENIFRSVNIALVNELKLIYDAMGIDVWEVIEAAKTKPFGFMPFYPGPRARRPLRADRPLLPHLEGAGSSTGRRASSNSPARSTPPCRPTWSTAWPAPSMRSGAGGSTARGFSSSASPTRRTSRTRARARRCG